MKVALKCRPKKFSAGYLLIPVTVADKYALNTICESIGTGIATVTVNHSRSTKSYDQCKTVFALIELYFFIGTGRYPTESEKALTYSRLLWQYAPRTEDPMNPGNMIPIPLSEQTRAQAAIFIDGIMAEVYESKNGLTENQEIELQSLFEDFYSHNGYGDLNPVDYDENGNLLSEEEWRKRNHFSFASGIQDDTLQLHHIISRGARRDLIDVPWNWIMLTDFEHNRIYHDKGWGAFLEIFPNCARRVMNAFIQGKHPMPLDLQKALIKLGLLDSLEDDYDQE